MSVEDDKKLNTASKTPGTRPASLSRRSLLKKGVTAMPAILTLQSGAALARSSNMISASSSDTTDGLGRTLCVDKSSVYPEDGYGEMYDLGNPPHAVVNVIRGPGETIFYETKNKSTPISPGALCERGGPAWFKPDEGQWESRQFGAGFVASSGSIASMADYVTDYLI